MVLQHGVWESCTVQPNFEYFSQVFTKRSWEIRANVYQRWGVKTAVGSQHWDVPGWRCLYSGVMLWSPQRPLETPFPWFQSSQDFMVSCGMSKCTAGTAHWAKAII